ncbi:MAG: NUDIX domain-containing protein [Methylococcales bacterium]|nr:NUDIX domain-containing protein [Methylococcales bacterium]
MKKDYKILEKKSLYDGFFRLESYKLQHTLFKGGWSKPIERELFRRNDCVGVILYDPKRDEVVLLEQFRVGPLVHKPCPWLLEIVAGGIEAGESKEDVARREAFEEAGCDIEELMFINEFYTSPGGASELLTLYCGKVDSTNIGGVYGLAEESEDILVTTKSFDEVYQLLVDGKIKSGIPIIAIQWLALNREKVRQKWNN